MRQTLANVNKLIEDEGLNLELVKGEGYFYFVGEGSEFARDASVLVCCLGHLDNDEWLRAARKVRRDIEKHRVTDEDMDNNPVFRLNNVKEN